MRVRITFGVNVRNVVIPFLHQPEIDYFIKDLTRNTKYEKFEWYTFSGLKGSFETTRDGLEVKGTLLTLVISSFNQDFIKVLIDLIFNLDTVRIGDLELIPMQREEENSIEYFEPEMKYLCISPIVVRDEYNEYQSCFDPSSDKFSDILYDSTMDRLEKLNIFSENQLLSFNKFQIIPDKYFIKKMENSGKNLYRNHWTNLNRTPLIIHTYSFPFTLCAEPEIQEFVYNCGIGEFTNHGFGMLDIVSKPNSENKPKLEQSLFNPIKKSRHVRENVI